jgi:hypothetical protein
MPARRRRPNDVEPPREARSQPVPRARIQHRPHRRVPRALPRVQNEAPRPETRRGAMNDPWSKIWFFNQAARRFSAEDLPVFRLATSSKKTFCPSLRPGIPARSTALICTKTSLLPSSGWMNPYPFWPLNHFTVPFVM